MPRKTETDYTTEYAAFLRERLPGLEIIKHADQFTGGIPDLSASDRSYHTFWLEVKRIKSLRHTIWNPKHWVDNAVQLDTAVRLGAWYLVIDPIHEENLLIKADDLYRQRNTLITEGRYEHVVGSRHLAYGAVLQTIIKELHP